jgi:anaphase-promoting complex subunit 8
MELRSRGPHVTITDTMLSSLLAVQNFEEAQVLFEDLLSRDPYRLEGADTFSNILFVREQPAALSLLAHR